MKNLIVSEVLDNQATLYEAEWWSMSGAEVGSQVEKNTTHQTTHFKAASLPCVAGEESTKKTG